MGKVRFGIPEEVALKLRDKYDLHHFIETGTYRAGTAAWAAGRFERAWTIEGDRDRWARCSSAHKDKTNLEFVFGDSRVMLAPTLAASGERALIWLDAHFMCDGANPMGDECPIREELAALAACGRQNIVMIDDARYFTGELPTGSDKRKWPDMAYIRKMLVGYAIAVYEDVVIAVPREDQHFLAELTGRPEIPIVVLTSNKYIHVANGFAYQLNKYWPGPPPVTLVRYDVRPYGLPSNFYAPSVGKQAELTWSAGLRRYLEYFTDEIILLMLEDYWLTKPVDLASIQRAYKVIDGDPLVGRIDLSGDLVKRDYNPVRCGMCVKPAAGAHYQMSLQAGLWRREFLLDYLDDAENPWQFEKNGTRRYTSNVKSGGELREILGLPGAALVYVNAVGGEGNAPGEYDRKKIPAALWNELASKGLVR